MLITTTHERKYTKQELKDYLKKYRGISGIDSKHRITIPIRVFNKMSQSNSASVEFGDTNDIIIIRLFND